MRISGRTGEADNGDRTSACVPAVYATDGQGSTGGNNLLTPLFDTTAEDGKCVGISAVEASGQGRAEGSGTTF